MNYMKNVLHFSLLFAFPPLLMAQEKDAQALFSELAGMAVETRLASSDSNPITMEDEPSLGQLGEDLLQLLIERDALAYLDSKVASSVFLAHAWEIEEAFSADIRASILASLGEDLESVLNMVSKLDLPDKEGTFQLKSIKIDRIANLSPNDEVLTGKGIEILLTLTSDAINKLDRKYQGEYVLHVDSAMLAPDGWKLTGHQMEWIRLPDALMGYEDKFRLSMKELNDFMDERKGWLDYDAHVRVYSKIGPSIDAMSITRDDDPYLGKLGEAILDLLAERDATAFLDSTVVSYDILGHAVDINEVALPDIRAQISSDLEEDVEEVLDMASKLALPKDAGTFQVKSIKVGRLVDRNSRDSEVLAGSEIEIRLALTPDAINKLDRKYQGEYVLYVDCAMRSVGGWGLFGRQIRWRSLPDALLEDEVKVALLSEDYLNEHGTLMPGTVAPEFTFYALEDGTEFDSKVELKGKVVVLEFWATWCGPCQEPMAHLQAYVEQNTGWKDKVEVLALSVDSNPERALAHLKKNGWTATRNVWSGPGEFNASAPTAYKVRSIPNMYLIGADGMIANAGNPWHLDVPSLVEDLLDNPEPPFNEIEELDPSTD